jgi:hypothetical protein
MIAERRRRAAGAMDGGAARQRRARSQDGGGPGSETIMTLRRPVPHGVQPPPVYFRRTVFRSACSAPATIR